MVLDGNIDPTSDDSGLTQIGGTAQDTALGFVKTHDRSVYRAIVKTAADLTADPVGLGGGNNSPDGTGSISPAVSLRSQRPGLMCRSWPRPSKSPEPLDLRPHSAPSIADWKAFPNTYEGGGFSVVNCLDYAQRLTGDQEAGIATTNARRYRCSAARCR